jgi:hypothetical protein
MTRLWAVEALLNYLAESPYMSGLYRLASLASCAFDGVSVPSRYGPYLKARFAKSTFYFPVPYGDIEVIGICFLLKV